MMVINPSDPLLRSTAGLDRAVARLFTLARRYVAFRRPVDTGALRQATGDHPTEICSAGWIEQAQQALPGL
jgi:hypothetical protein